MKNWNDIYPRPSLKRDGYMILNENWKVNGEPKGAPWNDLRSDDTLSYEITFDTGDFPLHEGKRMRLNFGAVDQLCEIRVNGFEAGWHEGGYLPFSLDISDYLNDAENTIYVDVTDELSTDYPYGKQCLKPHGMWYTPVSGIWQPVWLEEVPDHHVIGSVRTTPDFKGTDIEVVTDAPSYTLSYMDGDEEMILRCIDRHVRIDLKHPHVWTPDDPYLYDLAISTDTDRIETFFALRTTGTIERNGRTYFMLNGEPVFLNGVLDQGYFSDRFLPEDPEEYERDILRLKSLGFNMLRKHIKVEPEVFYHYADMHGMLVIQDMVNSGKYSFMRDTVIPTFLTKKLKERKPSKRDRYRRAFFEKHMLETVRHLCSHPSVIGWTVFNEGWGQFDSDRMYETLRKEDPSRFIDTCSGWFENERTDCDSRHIYFRTPVLKDPKKGKVLFLSECGGYTRSLDTNGGKKTYGYGKASDEKALTDMIAGLYEKMVLPSIENGLSGVVYTQISDVEGEINGIWSSDRKVLKADGDRLRKLFKKVYERFEEEIR